MSEIDAEVVRRLVTGRKNDGRAVYDPQAKAEVVRACLNPGVSVARMALQCGINANLLRRWITQSMGADMKASRANLPTVTMAGTDAFVPLRLAAPGAVPVTAAALKLRLHARLPNGGCAEFCVNGQSTAGESLLVRKHNDNQEARSTARTADQSAGQLQEA